MDDFPAFNEVWSKYFPKNPPAISLIACSTPGFICPDERIEINVIALRKDGGTRKRMVRAPVAMPYAGQSVAVRAGESLKTVRHSITYRRITIHPRVLNAEAVDLSGKSEFRWALLDDLGRDIPVSSLCLKIAALIRDASE